MIIGFVRHGRTDWNALGKIQGQTDIPLNEEGTKQAHLLADRLAHDSHKWDAVISSNLQRAYTTASIIADKLHIPLLEPDQRLRERYYGEVEGTTEPERLSRWGEKWREMDTGKESDASVRARGREFLDSQYAEHPDRNLLIVSHGSFLGQIFEELCGHVSDEYIGNMSYTILEYHNGGWTPLLYNCMKHLETSDSSS